MEKELEKELRCYTCVEFGGIKPFVHGERNVREVICNAGGAHWIPFNEIERHTENCPYVQRPLTQITDEAEQIIDGLLKTEANRKYGRDQR
jgi:hypothetical protein